MSGASQWCAALNFSRSRNAPDCNRKSSADFRSRFLSLVSNLISIFFGHHLKEGKYSHLQTTGFRNFHQKFYFVVHSKYNQPHWKFAQCLPCFPVQKASAEQFQINGGNSADDFTKIQVGQQQHLCSPESFPVLRPPSFWVYRLALFLCRRRNRP